MAETSRICAAELNGRAGQTISTTLLLTGVRERTGIGGDSSTQLFLADRTGEVLGFVWAEHRGGMLLPGALPAPVDLQAAVRLFNDRAQLHPTTLIGADVDAIGCATDLLPASGCTPAVAAALDRLRLLESSLSEPLAGFLRRVLMDPQIGAPLLRCRGSVRHHHSERGGLLIHSTELLDLARTAARATLPKEPEAPMLAGVATLLHDIGKLETVGELRRPELCFALRHETRTLHLLAPHLHWLRGRDARLHAALSYILEYLATPASARKSARYLVAEIVLACDHWSAAGFTGRGIEDFLDGKKPCPAVASGTPAANDPDFPQSVSGHGPS